MFDVLDRTPYYDSQLTFKRLAVPLLSSMYQMFLNVCKQHFFKLGVSVIIIDTLISVT